MTDLTKLASDVAAYSSTMMSANARFESLRDQSIDEESAEGLRRILEELRGVLADVSAVDGMDVTFYATLQEARALLDAIEGALENIDVTAPSVVEGWMVDTVAAIEAALGSAGAPETLSARLQRRLREARAAEDDLAAEAAAAEDAAGAEETDAEADAAEGEAEDAGADVFDPMAFETVEQVDAEIARYEAEIAALNADLAGYTEVIRQLDERRGQIESGADAAVDEANQEAIAA